LVIGTDLQAVLKLTGWSVGGYDVGVGQKSTEMDEMRNYQTYLRQKEYKQDAEMKIKMISRMSRREFYDLWRLIPPSCHN
jgi:hypothetical protein